MSALATNGQIRSMELTTVGPAEFSKKKSEFHGDNLCTFQISFLFLQFTPKVWRIYQFGPVHIVKSLFVSAVICF